MIRGEPIMARKSKKMTDMEEISSHIEQLINERNQLGQIEKEE